MKRDMRLPPFAAIRAFEACARHENFTRAAEELGMSQAAVSYQIKVLEERVGSTLFLRRSRRVSLTEVGRALATPTIDAFDRLRTGFAAVDLTTQRTLSISTTPTFAANWLSPRLGGFQIAHSNMAVRVETGCEMIDITNAEIDVAIRYGDGNWPGLQAHRLLDAAFSPMLSPGLLERVGGLNKPSDLMDLNIINPEDPYWSIWLNLAGVDAAKLSGRIGSYLGSQTNEARAALEGQGVAMLSPDFFRHELTTGRLVQPFDLLGTDGCGHWLVYLKSRSQVPKIKAFRKWILSEVANEEDYLDATFRSANVRPARQGSQKPEHIA